MSDDLLCRCLGADHRTNCVRKAAEEDGLCDPCRVNGCETSPLGWYMRETERHIDAMVQGHITRDEYDQQMDVTRERYISMCMAEERQP